MHSRQHKYYFRSIGFHVSRYLLRPDLSEREKKEKPRTERSKNKKLVISLVMVESGDGRE